MEMFNGIFEEKPWKIMAIIKNYKGLTSEFPPFPVVFSKPSTSVIREGELIEIPEGTELIHEIELGVFLKSGGKNLEESEIDSLIGGYFIALDITAINLQREVMREGYPWLFAKGCDSFLPISQFVPKESINDPYNLVLELFVNGELRQSGRTSDMYYNIQQTLSYTSKYMTLSQGDALLTGTPPGIGPIVSGDKLEAFLKQDDEVLIQSAFSVR